MIDFHEDKYYQKNCIFIKIYLYLNLFFIKKITCILRTGLDRGRFTFLNLEVKYCCAFVQVKSTPVSQRQKNRTQEKIGHHSTRFYLEANPRRKLGCQFAVPEPYKENEEDYILFSTYRITYTTVRPGPQAEAYLVWLPTRLGQHFKAKNCFPGRKELGWH